MWWSLPRVEVKDSTVCFRHSSSLITFTFAGSGLNPYSVTFTPRYVVNGAGSISHLARLSLIPARDIWNMSSVVSSNTSRGIAACISRSSWYTFIKGSPSLCLLNAFNTSYLDMSCSTSEECLYPIGSLVQTQCIFIALNPKSSCWDTFIGTWR